VLLGAGLGGDQNEGQRPRGTGATSASDALQQLLAVGLEHLEPGHAGHVQVEDRELRLLTAHELQGVHTIPRLEHLEAQAIEDLAQRLAQGVVVVGDEDAALAHERA
jgi:hypothetical protein